MKIAIMGAGFVGESLARAVTKIGYEVMLSSRNPQSEKIQQLIADIGDKAQAGTIEETFNFSDVVAIALSSDAALEVAKNAGDWSGKTVLDMTQGDMVQLQKIMQTAVVKIFNSIGAEHYQNPVFDGQVATMLYCGDDTEAKQLAHQLAAELGFEAMDAGDSTMGTHLANLAQLWVGLMLNGIGRDFAFQVIRR